MSNVEQNVERRVDCLEMRDRVGRLEYWRDGNGAKGAEERLQNIEHKVNAIFIMVAVVIGQSAIELLIGYLI